MTGTFCARVSLSLVALGFGLSAFHGVSAAGNPNLGTGDYVAQAMKVAGPRWQAKAADLCNLDVRERPDPIANASPSAPITPRLPSDWAIKPMKIFDHVYFVGSKLVSSFAIDTPEGIIITDSMGDIDVSGAVEGGLVALGLDPKRIRYVIIPHGHPDHYGGAKYLKEHFGAKIVMARGDVDTLRFYGARVTTTSPEDFDVLVGDGDTLTLGGTTVTFVVMPGHTPGGILMHFPVSSNGAQHRMMIWSAGGSPNHVAADINSQLPALARLEAAARKFDIDAVADNHGSHILVQQMREQPGTNPFLVGKRDVLGYLQLRSACGKAWLGHLQNRGATSASRPSS